MIRSLINFAINFSSFFLVYFFIGIFPLFLFGINLVSIVISVFVGLWLVSFWLDYNYENENHKDRKKQQLRQLEIDLFSETSVIGKLLQLEAAHKLIELIEDDSLHTVRILANAVSDSKNRKVQETILDALQKIDNQSHINAICKVWADTRHRDLANSLVKKRWIASEPVALKVITALKANQPQVIINGDEEIVEPLLNAFKDKDSEIANRASECAISLTDSKAIDYICQKWVKNRDKFLEQIVCRGKYVGQKPVELKVLTALKAGNFEKLTSCNEEIVTPLLNAINDRDNNISHNAKQFIFLLNNSNVLDAIFIKWAVYRDSFLEEVLCQRQYVVSNPVSLKVLTALKVNRLDVIRECGQEAIEPLLQALNDADVDISNRVRKCIFSLTNSEATDYICDLAIKQSHKVACEIAIKAKYAPRQPDQRALFYFLTDQWKKYESLDYEHKLLQKSYELGNDQLRQQIAEKIKQAGYAELIKVIAGGNRKKRLSEMTDAEWETTIELLVSNRQWEEMWRLVREAPAVWNVQLLGKLDKVGWLPETEQEQIAFASLKKLANKCSKEIEIQPIDNLDCQVTLTNSGRILGFSPDSQILASSHGNKEIKLWQMPHGEHLATLPISDIFRKNAVSFSPDSKMLASYDCSIGLRLWKMPHGEHLATLPTNDDIKPISCGVNFSPDSKILASYNCSEKEIKLWKMPHGEHLATLSTNNDITPRGISFSPDSKILASYDHSGEIKLWQMPHSKHLITLSTDDEGSRFGVNFSPDGKILASYGNKIRLWKMPHGEHFATLSIDDEDSLFGEIDFSSDGKILAGYGSLQEIKLWQVSNGQILPSFMMHRNKSKWDKSIKTYSHDSKVLVRYDLKEGIRLWKIPDGQLIATFYNDAKRIYEMTISPDGKIFANCAETIRLWTPHIFWTLDILRLTRLSIRQLSWQNRDSVQKALRNQEITELERYWLEFMQALIDRYQLYDVEIEDASRLISTGEFDIEIEG